MSVFQNKKFVVECLIILIVLTVISYLVFPHFLDAQLRRKVEQRKSELQAFVERFQKEEIQYLQEKGLISSFPVNVGFIQDMSSRMNVKFLLSSVGGPCAVDSFRGSIGDCPIEGMHILTTVNRSPNYLIWIVGAPVSDEREGWSRFTSQLTNINPLQNHVAQRAKELGTYNPESYQEYFRPFMFDPSNGLGSDGAIVVMTSYELPQKEEENSLKPNK